MPESATLAVGGFGLCSIPSVLIEAFLPQGATDLEVVSNNCGVDEAGLALLRRERPIRRRMSSYAGQNKDFARQYLRGELEVVFTPRGTLAERIRAGGSGIRAFVAARGGISHWMISAKMIKAWAEPWTSSTEDDDTSCSWSTGPRAAPRRSSTSAL